MDANKRHQLGCLVAVQVKIAVCLEDPDMDRRKRLDHSGFALLEDGYLNEAARDQWLQYYLADKDRFFAWVRSEARRWFKWRRKPKFLRKPFEYTECPIRLEDGGRS